MTKKILLPLLAAPLLLASCSGGNAKPGAFEQGDPILNAELISAFFQENEAPKVGKAQLSKEVQDKEGNPVWSMVDYASEADAAGFIVYKKSATVEGVTTDSYEAYNKWTLQLVASWEENDDLTALAEYGAHFEMMGSLPFGMMLICKRVYVMKDEIKTYDHDEYVAYDAYGHKLLEWKEDAELAEFAGYTAEMEEFEDPYNPDATIELGVVTVKLWNKDHYEPKRFVYSEDFSKISAEKESDRFAYGYFEDIAYEVEEEGVKYTFTSSNDNMLEVYKEGEEKPISVISKDVYLEASEFAMYGFNVYYVLDHTVEDTNSDFSYIDRTTEGNEIKIRQEVYKVELLKGETKKLETNYIVGGLYNFVALEDATYGLMQVSQVKEDKTIDPLTERYFVVDEDLALHDNITYSPIVAYMSGQLIFKVGSHYLNKNTMFLYDEMLNPVASIESDDLAIYNVIGDKIVLKDVRTNMYGLFDETGKNVVPFVVKSIVSYSGTKAIVTDVNGTYGLLDLAKSSIEWFKSSAVSSDMFLYVSHNVAAEGEPEELHYHTYFQGEYLGDFDHKLMADLIDYDIDMLTGSLKLLLCEDVAAEDTSVTETVSLYTYSI